MSHLRTSAASYAQFCMTALGNKFLKEGKKFPNVQWMQEIWTPRQIVQRAGREKLCALLEISSEAPRKWYATGIPARHWETLVEHYEWLSYDILARANKIAYRKVTRKKGVS